MLGVAGGTDSVFRFLTGTRSDEQGSRKYRKCENVGLCDFIIIIIIIIIIIVIITDIVIMYNMSLVSAATSVNRHSLW
jgi:flagellar basal body-associated protein FliL